VDTGIGAPVRRREDLRFVTGSGSYSEDYSRPDQLYGVMVRTPHAHARVTRIETAAAKAAPGVLAVLTRAEYDADGLNEIPSRAMQMAPEDITKQALFMPDGSPGFEHSVAPLIADKSHHVGEGVAFVVADTLAHAKDAAELVEVEYDAMKAVVRGLDALQPSAPEVWDGIKGNFAFDSYVGDCAKTEEAYKRAKWIVEGEFVSNRVANCPMEPRACLAEVVDGRYILWTGGQGVHGQKSGLAHVFKCDPSKVRVVQKDVGGGFGPRGHLHAEYVCAMWAAKRLGRPVKWVCERTEAFVADYQARDMMVHASLAIDENGKFIGMKGTCYANLGGNTVNYVPPVNYSRISTTLYDIPNLCLRVVGILTNTLPSLNYRAAGRPQAMLTMERLIDIAAEKTGIDRIELRRRNFIRTFPYKTQGGLTYDCGEFERNMDWTMDIADWSGFAARKEEARKRGRLRGIGLGNYIETPAGIPVERSRITVKPEGDGEVEIIIGTLSQGQGHETSFPQVVSEWLGVDYDKVHIVQGDSDIVPEGGGTHSDRSMRLGGFVMVKACDQIIDKGRRIAAHVLEAAAEDIEFAKGRFTVAGTDRSISIFDAAKAAATSTSLPAELRGKLDGDHKFVGRIFAFPNGCAVCEVEIDPDTGVIEIVSYACVDDVGRVINPLIVDGQVHGGIVQGVGQAMMEHVVYDEAGSILAGSFMDYAMPHADDVPSFKVETNNDVPTKGNPLGVKGGGEAGTTGALATFMNAVHDALKPVGVTRLDMPASPHRVWRAIQEAKKKAGAKAPAISS
jgi:carbon-monoxide dehydrogenase large subunit